ncbi:arylamine N-acetyltransferase [Streptomyces sp. NPDC051907]|uniref:arylamine N-acetyltransferase family protein n=1 Tax=Streptomyces sp. NPDC051907 TaxID=3155284 RepID=UPI00341D798F
MTWNSEDLDLDAYLARIGYEGEPAPDLETLRALQRAHVAAIPFENLEVALGHQVPLDLKSLQAKLVGRRRGGYCYEQNSLFAAVLERIGFTVAGRGARVRANGAALRPVTHAVLAVTVEDRLWLADTGFGAQGITEPMPLQDGAQVEQGGWSYGIRVESEGIHVLTTLGAEGWSDLYAFSPQTLYPADFMVMNHYSSSHPQSRFVGQVVAQRPGREVRTALVRDGLTLSRPDGTVERRSVPVDELIAVLAGTFDIELDAAEAAALVRVHSAGE